MNDTDIDRRKFLKKSAVTPIGAAGLLAQNGGLLAQDSDQSAQDGDQRSQDEPSVARTTRRIALDYPERLEGDPRRKILLMTDRVDDDPDVSEVEGCAFSDWPTDNLGIWEGIIVDWQNEAGDYQFGFYGGTPTITADKLVELDTIYVDEQDTPVPLGTPFIVNRIEECPDEWVGMTATQLPSIDIKTGPGVSTDG